MCVCVCVCIYIYIYIYIYIHTHTHTYTHSIVKHNKLDIIKSLFSLTVIYMPILTHDIRCLASVLN